MMALSLLVAYTNSSYQKVLPILPDQDLDSKDLMTVLLCSDCRDRQQRCPGCKWLNSPISMVEMEDLQLVRNSFSVVSHPSEAHSVVLCDYPFRGDLATKEIWLGHS